MPIIAKHSWKMTVPSPISAACHGTCSTHRGVLTQFRTLKQYRRKSYKIFTPIIGQKLSSYATAQYSSLSWLLIATVTMSITALFLVAGCLFAWRKVQCVTGILLSLSKFLLTDWWKWVVSWFDSTSYIMITTLYTTYAEEPRVRVSKKIIDDITESSCI